MLTNKRFSKKAVSSLAGFVLLGSVSAASVASGPVLVTNAEEISGPIVTGISALADQISALAALVGTGFDGLTSAIANTQGQAGDATNNFNKSLAVAQYEYQYASNIAQNAGACVNSVVANTANSNNKMASYNQSVGAYTGHVKAGTAPPGPDQQRLIQSVHVSKYCDKQTDPNQCAGVKPVSNGSTTNEQMVNSDASSATIFSGAGSPGHVANLTFSPTQTQAGQDFITNAIDGTDTPRQLSKAEYNTPQGFQYEGLRVAYEARMSTARNAMEDILASRTIAPGSYATLQAMETADQGKWANYIKKRLNDPSNGILLYSNGTAPGTTAGDASPMELLDIEVGRRADNPDWITNVSADNSVQSLLRGLSFMMADMIKMQYMSLKLQQEALAISATNSASATKADMLPQVMAAEQQVMHGAAQLQPAASSAAP
jgi:hypothetical protein